MEIKKYSKADESLLFDISTCSHERIKTVELFPRTEGTHKTH